ncbi:MAG: serine/threonine-protein phosphatase [Ketobacter sp.]|nr:MAG: serine/threonine-protein phosphatase [Ketobacter sp.]
MPLCCYSESLIGGRSENQDFALSFELGQDVFAVLCDGMGGYADGGWAAATFAQSVKEVVTRHIPEEEVSPEQAMTDWLQRAWLLFCDKHQLQRRHRQAQTTFVLAWLARDFTLVAHAGDSRCYGLRPDAVLWCTQDHNLYELGVMNGDIDPRHTPKAQGQHALLYRSVGRNKPLKPTLTLHPALCPGQALTLCSDGLWSQVRDPEWLALVAAEDAAGSLQALLRTAVQRGGARADNATALLVRFE